MDATPDGMLAASSGSVARKMERAWREIAGRECEEGKKQREREKEMATRSRIHAGRTGGECNREGGYVERVKKIAETK